MSWTREGSSTPYSSRWEEVATRTVGGGGTVPFIYDLFTTTLGVRPESRDISTSKGLCTSGCPCLVRLGSMQFLRSSANGHPDYSRRAVKTCADCTMCWHRWPPTTGVNAYNTVTFAGPQVTAQAHTFRFRATFRWVRV